MPQLSLPNRNCRRQTFGVFLAMLAHVCFAQSGSTDFSGDMTAARSFIQNYSQTTGATVQSEYAGSVDTSTIGSLGTSSTSLGAHKSANLERIAECRTAAASNYIGMTDQQKVECHAIITAANISYTPNPYLDATSPTASTAVSPSNVLTPTVTRSLLSSQESSLQSVKSGAISNPLAFSSTTNCAQQSTTTAPVTRLDSCRIEKPIAPVTCEIPISVSVSDGVVTSRQDTSACSVYATNPHCAPTGEVCTLETAIDTGELDDSGNPIMQTACVAQTRMYECWNVDAAWNTQNCQSLAGDPLCTATGIVTPVQLSSGVPVWQDVEYSCQLSAGGSVTNPACTSTICMGETCFDATPKASQDFGSMAVGMEMLREAGTYAHGPDEDNIRVFQGAGSSCKRPTGIGIGKNCCQSSGGVALQTNRDVLPSLAWQAAGSVAMATGRYGVQQASNYMYDFMFTSGGEWMQEKAVAAWSSGAWAPTSGFNMSLGAYGFTMQIGEMSSFSFSSLFPSDAASLLSDISTFWDSGTFSLGETMIGGTPINFQFNVYTLAATIAIKVITEMNSCTLEEKMLSARRGGNLCIKTGEYCSMRLPWPLKMCIQITETWCCWDSRLAQIVAIQGGAQLGGGPRCGGFTPDELAQIDFAQIDFSSFQNEMLAGVVIPEASYNAATATLGADRAVATRSTVDPSGTANTATDANLRTYVEQRVGTMLNK